MGDTVPRIATLLLIKLTIFIYNLSESFWIANSTERQTDSCDESSDSYESIKDSTALGRGSDGEEMVGVGFAEILYVKVVRRVLCRHKPGVRRTGA